MRKNITIKIGAGPNRNNDGDDILQLKQALQSLDYYETPSYGITPYPDDGIFSAIRDFQTDMDLTVDGIVKPNGETERALNKQISMGVRSPRMTCIKCG